MKTTEQTIKDFNIIHSHKYDYSLVQYKGSKTKVKIICREHGVFEQRPDHHLIGHGCSICSKNNKNSNNDFKYRANKIHNNYYDYSLVQYKNAHTKIKIICPKHGIFEQLPQNHLIKKNGCPHCYNEKRYSNLLEFIKKSNIIHNYGYDYSLVNYRGNNIRVKIICKKHGIFEQTPSKHLLNQGCPICSESKGEKEIRMFLEKNNIDFNIQKKFNGCSYERLLKFDFYLPEHNICIEYDGLQHFKPVEFFGGETRFKYQKKIDQIKTDFCKNNDINLVRIRYSENIEEKLNFLFYI